MLVDLSDLVRTLARGPNEKRPFDGRVDIDELADAGNIAGGAAPLLPSRGERGATATPHAGSPETGAPAPRRCGAGAQLAPLDRDVSGTRGESPSHAQRRTSSCCRRRPGCRWGRGVRALVGERVHRR